MNNMINTSTSYNAGYQRNVGATNTSRDSITGVLPVFKSTQKPKEDLLELSDAYKSYAASAKRSKVAVLNSLNAFISTPKKNKYDSLNISDSVSRNEDVSIYNDLSAYQKMGVSVYMRNAGYFLE